MIEAREPGRKGSAGFRSRLTTCLLWAALAAAALGAGLIWLADRRAVVSPSDREVLSSLAYVAAPSRDRPEGGVTVHDRRRAWPGLNLVASPEELRYVDMEGREVGRVPGSVTLEALEQGAVTLEPGPPDMLLRRLVRLDSAGQPLWFTQEACYHHDVAVDPRGRIYVPSGDLGATMPNGRPNTRGNCLSVLDFHGRELERIPVDTLLPEGGREPWYYFINSVRLVAEEIPGVARRGDVLLGLPHLGAVALIDPEARQLRWYWNLPVRYTHDAHFYGANLLIFDNGGLDAERSEVVELDPRTGEKVWSYQAEGFHSGWGGSAQRLPNGNTLITQAVEGRVFEVTPQGEVVWEYYQSQDQTASSGIYRVRRLSGDAPLR
ncbi:MAG TPA: arylsulfotransferase family protein [Candidatus Nitrosotenuis sp.]|nr:arylsulfotransferase family protein [Candidatus Nitrosotenuis sp.]